MLSQLFLRHFSRGNISQVAHHFEAVGQFDEDHARVFGVAHDQVAEVGRLLLRALSAGSSRCCSAPAVMPSTSSPKRRRISDVTPIRSPGSAAGGEPHHVVQDGRQRGVAPQSDFGDDDACDACGVIQQRRSVVAHQSGEFPVGILPSASSTSARVCSEKFARTSVRSFSYREKSIFT